MRWWKGVVVVGTKGALREETAEMKEVGCWAETVAGYCANLAN